MGDQLDIQDVVESEFAFKALATDRSIEARLTGAADARATTLLDKFVSKVHAEAKRLKVSEVCVDMMALQFMNSSCFKSLVAWLGEIGQLAPEQRYLVRFRWDVDSFWQRRSLQALKAFALHVVVLDPQIPR